MSETEIRSRGGLPYGGMPNAQILGRYETTDPQTPFGGTADEGDAAPTEAAEIGEYEDYVRDEIRDWTPDEPYLESDHPRRDPALSRSIINLRTNGTRGAYDSVEGARHPELFVGFTDHDPRGTLLDPRFDQMRGQITARAAELTVRMGENDDRTEAESPWSNQAISYARKSILRRMRSSMKIFTAQKEGRPWGRHITSAANALRGRFQRDKLR